jgi:LmbE family N-acetylglucosaminyl deacetylase
MSAKVAIAVAAHPDDIEFLMGGTLLLLKRAGWETHYLNVSSGNCGSQKMGPEETARVRGEEAKQAAELLGATWHEGFSHDLEILYDMSHLRKLAAIVRGVAPDVVLTHAPQDYMEDHTNVCRLAVTAAFTHSMPNFETEPPTEPPFKEVSVYHAMPYGLRDNLRKRVTAGLYVDVAEVAEEKLAALSAHESQRSWLDASQGLDSYLAKMEELDREVGRLSGRYERAEGWRRHHHLGFSGEDVDPLADALTDHCFVNQEYERNLEKGN